MRSRSSGSPASARALEAAQIGVGHLLVPLDREEQRHVDVDPRGRQLLDRRQARARSPGP